MDSKKSKDRVETSYDFEEKRKNFIDNFKIDLNNFMYDRVPGKITIDEFEALTCDIHERVCKEWEKFI
jgi:hypothetical protein